VAELARAAREPCSPPEVTRRSPHLQASFRETLEKHELKLYLSSTEGLVCLDAFGLAIGSCGA
jgi:hypothetical protein